MMSSLETEVLDSLEDLRYVDWESIRANVQSINDLQTFSSIVGWLSNQLTQLNAALDCVVNPITTDTDLKSFEIELNSLLKDMCSPFAGYGSALTIQNKLAIINYLCGELLASRMNAVNQTVDKPTTNGTMSITMNESETGKDLKSVLISLGMGKPPPNITSQLLFAKLIKKVKDYLVERKLSVEQIEDSLLLPNGLSLSPNQWKTLLQINNQFYNDYKVRRNMLLTRCDCTVSSFKWKSSKSDDKSKSNTNTDLDKQLDNAYSTERYKLNTEPNVTISDALAARDSDCDLLLNSRISVSHIPCIVKLTGMANKGAQQQLVQQDLHKFLIGTVPDRGGRPDEQPPPPKESFNQQQHQRDNPQQRGRGGRGNFASGGRGAGNVSTNQQQRVQGTGWAQNSGSDRYSSNQSQESGYSSKGVHRDQQYDNYQSTAGQHNYQSGQQQQRYNDNYHQTGHQKYGDSYQSGQQRFGDNYSSGQQRYGSAQHSYQHDSGQQHYRAPQQFSSSYQMDYQQSNDRRGYNYSDNYGNPSTNTNTNAGDNYQQQSYYGDTTYYNQRDRNYNRGNRRGTRR